MRSDSTPRLKNEFRVDGDVTTIFLPHRPSGITYELLIDTVDLSRVMTTCRRIRATTQKLLNGETLVYARFQINSKTVYFHRWLMDAPQGKVVDHWNGNGLDCRRRNMRLTTQALNMTNRRNDVYHAHKLVMEHKSGKHWAAWVFLGEFPTKEEAERIYAQAHATLVREGLWEDWKRTVG